jgi:DNA repair protein RecN (Recombination protein N)
MLVELVIKDFALIEHVSIRWSEGFNVLTGETGAGKSIIIDALDAVLGGRVNNSLIRQGKEKATIEAGFAVNQDIADWLKEQDIDLAEGEQLTLFREIGKTGSKARINGTPVNVSSVQELRQKLLSIHTQHEARTLMSNQSQREMLDSMGDRKHGQLLSKVQELYSQKQELAAKVEELSLSDSQRAQRLDFARFQWQELDETQIVNAHEYDEINQRLNLLRSSHQLVENIEATRQILSERTEEPSVIDQLELAIQPLQQAAKIDPSLNSCLDALSQAHSSLQDSARELRHYGDNLEGNPEELFELESRLNTLVIIKRKYGPTLEDALQKLEELNHEIETLENHQSALEDLERRLSALDDEYIQAANKLSSNRKLLASKLDKDILSELAELGMERCKFTISISQDKPSSSGIDVIEFLIAPNPGQPLQPVARIASGGELSRVMLSIKSVLANRDSIPTVIFDEIDTGLSGKVLQSMRDKLAKLAKTHQILCITHQPLIASVANNHIQVEKLQSKNSTSVKVQELDETNRIKAIAGMASGHDAEENALNFAQMLYNQAAPLR